MSGARSACAPLTDMSASRLEARRGRARAAPQKKGKKTQPRSRSDSSELSTSTHRASTAVAAAVAAAAAAMDSTSLVSLSTASFQHHRALGTRHAQSGRGGTVACTAVCTLFSFFPLLLLFIKRGGHLLHSAVAVSNAESRWRRGAAGGGEG